METQINNLIPKLKKSDFVFHRAQTLFGPAWENLKEGACIYCGSALKPMSRKEGWVICPSRKHRKTFLISVEKMHEVIMKIGVDNPPLDLTSSF